MGEWRIGYAASGWTTLTSYLRGRGHHDDTIQAAGLARISSRGTLIDHFRDRVMLPVHDEQGNLAGFIGRVRPGTGPDIPKYLNGPATSTYQKGDLLFGLHHARGHLARGAATVIVEGPFDAIAVALADPHHYAGLAPCGTALTSRQAAALSRAADLLATPPDVFSEDDLAQLRGFPEAGCGELIRYLARAVAGSRPCRSPAAPQRGGPRCSCARPTGRGSSRIRTAAAACCHAGLGVAAGGLGGSGAREH
jgi:DNA primase catalytic core, N-terminal domain